MAGARRGDLLLREDCQRRDQAEERACIPFRPQRGRKLTFAHWRFDRSSVTRPLSRNLASSQPNVKTRALQQIEMLSASCRARSLSLAARARLKMPRGLSPSSPPTLLGPPAAKQMPKMRSASSSSSSTLPNIWLRATSDRRGAAVGHGKSTSFSLSGGRQ